MSDDVFDSLVEERIAQLEKFSERRNALLQEMYQILRRRNNVGAILTIDDEDEDDLHVFLNKCNLRTHPDTGYIGHLPESDLFSLVTALPAPSPPPSLPSSKDKPRSQRSTSVISDKSSTQQLPRNRGPSGRPAFRPLVEHGDSDDELDLIGSPAQRSLSSVPVDVKNTPEPIPVVVEKELDTVQAEIDEEEVVEEEVKDQEAEGAEEVVPESSENGVGKELMQENAEKDQEAQAQAVGIQQAMEEIVSTEEIPLELSSHLDPLQASDDLPQNTFIEPSQETENVVMEDLHHHIQEPLPKEPVTVSSPLTSNEAQEQDADATDDEPMILDSSPLQPPRQLPEISSPQNSLPEQPVSNTSEITPAVEDQSTELLPDVEMDIDVPSTEENKVADSSSSEVLIETKESAQPEVSQADIESIPEIVASKEETSRPIRSSIPPLPSEYCYGTPEPIVMAEPPSPQFIDPPSASYTGFGDFDFPSDSNILLPSTSPEAPSQPRHPIDFDYPLPPVDSLPIEFNRKRRLKQQKKKEKEREKGEFKKDKDGGKDDWIPWGANRWIATIRTNPVHKKVSKATKCLMTRDWNVAMQELKLLRTMEQIERLKSHGRWSFRQPKKQRGVGGLQKTHWDYLMDEMKWMRTDFREERKWKMALAYNLSTAVLEWHAAGSLEKRLKRGICVLWKPPRQDNNRSESEPALDPIDLEPPQSQNPPEQSLLMLDYGSDDDEEDDQDKDQQSVGDALDTRTMMEDSLQAAEQDKDDNGIGLKDLEPKQEQQDDSANLENSSMDVDALASGQETHEVKDEIMEPVTEQQIHEADPSPSGLRSSSSNPILGNVRKSNSHSSEPSAIPQSKTSRKNLYAPLREKIAYSDFDKLFLDLDDFHISTPGTDTTGDGGENSCLLPPSDLSDIFPDLQPYTLLDVAPSAGEERKPRDKKSDRDDPNKRIEEAAYTKVYPASKFIHMKPTLISALQPANHFKDGRWTNLDETPIYVEHDAAPVRITDDFSNSLFDHKVVPAQLFAPTLGQPAPSLWVPKDKDGKPREAPKREHQWSSNDDALLKSLVDKYLNNWELVAESFNAMSQTVKTDRRTSRDCQERWKERFGQDRRVLPETPSGSAIDATTSSPQAASLSTANQVATRGVKRVASNSISSPSIPGSSNEFSNKKRRRHTLMQDLVRKAAKKRIDTMQKINPRKPPITHESHAAYNKMPKMSPADLSRLKADREFNDQQQYQQLARARAQAQQQQAQQQVQQMQQQQQQQQQQPNGTQGQGQGRVTPTAQVNGQAQPTGVATTNGVSRTSTSGLQTQGNTVPQIRSQVTQVPISGQQRSNTPFTNARYPAQQNQQQLQQIRAQQHALSQALAAQMQAQAASAASSSNGGSQPLQQNGQASVNTSPPYTATNSRDATSSPAGPHGSPPRTSATPNNAVNSPRPVPAQTGQAQAQSQQSQPQGQQQNQTQGQSTGMGVQMQPHQMSQAGIAGILQNVQQNGQMGVGVGIPRANIPGYYLSNVIPNLQGYSPEQIQNIMRLQALHNQAQHAQQQNQQQQQ